MLEWAPVNEVKLPMYVRKALRSAALLCAVGLLAVGCSTLTSEGPDVSDKPRPPLSPAAAVEKAAKPTETRPFPDDSVFDLLVAEFALRRQHFDLALNNYLYQARETRDPGVVAAAARLARFVNDDRAAMEAVDLWLALEPDNLDAHYLAAATLAKMRKPQQALPHMAKVLKAGGETNFAALAASALTLPNTEQQEFLAGLERLLASHPDDPSLKTAKALMLQYRNKEKEALELIRDVLEKDPTDLHALLIETRLLEQLSRPEEALERMRFAVQAHPDNKRLRLQLAQSLTRADLEEARAHYAILAQQYPEDPDILLGLALINRELGDTQAARQQLEQLRQLATHQSRAHYFLGRIAEEEQRWNDALAHYRQVGPSEEFSSAVKRLAIIAEQEKGLDEARRELADVREQYPEHEVQLTLIESDLLFEHRAYRAGHDLLTRALEAYPQEPNLLYARSLFSERLRNVALLERDLRTILEADPDNATALNALGYSLAILTDRLEEARALVEKALEIRPQDPSIQDSYGWIAYRQGNLEMAHTWLERAFKQAKDHEIAAHLGEVLWKLGERERAREVWIDGLQHEPDSPIISETLQRLNVDLQQQQ